MIGSTYRLVFLKLGGSLITDKTRLETIRDEVLDRLAAEILKAQKACPDIRLLIGHGSGSFGHTHAARYGTRLGVRSDEQWMGFSQVSAAASRLNKMVWERLLKVGIPAKSLQPSASAMCEDGQIVAYSIEPIKAALDAGLTPIVYGDVAFDTTRGGTIISTEEIFTYLALKLRPSWLLLAGETPGVLDANGKVITLIGQNDLGSILQSLGSSRGTDVTGGMASKVLSMLELANALPGLNISIFSGMEPGLVERVICDGDSSPGTLIRGET